MLCFRVNQNYSLINGTVEHDKNAEPEAKKKKKDKRKKLEKQQSDPEICLGAPISKTPTSCIGHTVS